MLQLVYGLRLLLVCEGIGMIDQGWMTESHLTAYPGAMPDMEFLGTLP